MAKKKKIFAVHFVHPPSDIACCGTPITLEMRRRGLVSSDMKRVTCFLCKPHRRQNAPR